MLVRGMNRAIQRFLQNAPHMTAEYVWLRHLPNAATSDAIFTSHYAAIRFFAWCRQQGIGEDSMNKHLILYCLKSLSQSGDTHLDPDMTKIRTVADLMDQNVWQDRTNLWEPVQHAILNHLHAPPCQSSTGARDRERSARQPGPS